MVVKTPKGFVVYSEDKTKRLGGPYKTKAEAEGRLKQIEYFKNKPEGGSYGGKN